MNEENVLENENDSGQDISSSKTSDVTSGKESTEDVHASKQTEATDYTELIEQVTNINQKLDNITNISIVCMVGIGIVIGILACNIFSKYFHS